MTEEQKAKKAEKQAKRREYFEKKRQERLENGVKEEESGNSPSRHTTSGTIHDTPADTRARAHQGEPGRAHTLPR